VRDSLPEVLGTLKYADGSVVILTDTSVQFSMRRVNPDGSKTDVIVDRAATIVNPATGQVKVKLTTVDTVAGDYEYRWHVMWIGERMSFPNGYWRNLKIS
jgi:hypothetical protein